MEKPPSRLRTPFPARPPAAAILSKPVVAAPDGETDSGLAPSVDGELAVRPSVDAAEAADPDFDEGEKEAVRATSAFGDRFGVFHRHELARSNTVDTVKENIKASESHVKRARDVKRRPTWSPIYTITASTITNMMYMLKDDVKTGRKAINLTAMPRPVHISIKKVRIPRRLDALPAGMTAERADGTIKAEWLDATTPHPKPGTHTVILYAHGGAYFFGSRKTHRQVTWRLAKYAGARVLAIDYRLAPEHLYPAQLHDMVSAYLYLTDPPADSGLPKYRPDQVVFMGDSSGGNLCTVATLWLRDQARFGIPAGLGLICPWMDLTHSSPSYVFNGKHDILPASTNDPKHGGDAKAHYFTESDAQLVEPYVSPIFSRERADRVAWPRTLIQIGDAERLRDENIIFYAEAFPNSNIRVEVFEDMIHVWHLFATAEVVSREAIRRLADFAKSVVTVDPKDDAAAAAAAAGPSADAAAPAKFSRGIVKVMNRKGFPEEPFGDPIEFLREQRKRLEEYHIQEKK
ncbi:Alpha/Beta hydrolase protein [Zopfochytrium polystomum]|nr:Alpha/Beta hydrolase protein [Zopfochytrium polystomum]